MTRSSRSSSSKKQVAWEWSAAEGRDLIEACTRFGGQWQEVEKFVGRNRADCMERWDVIVPLDWKSFGSLSWPDEDILRLVQAVRSNQYDNEKRCYVSTKDCDWSVVATIMNEDVWQWDAEDCEQMWYELQSTKPFRLGDFTKLEDDILAERVIGWGPDQRGLWRWLSDILKRDHVVLRSRWNVIKKEHNGFQSAHKHSSTEPSLYGSALLSDLGLQDCTHAQPEACNSLWSSPVVVDPAPHIQLATLPGFTPSEGLVRTFSTERLVHSHADAPALRNTRLFDSSFDSTAAGPVSGCSSKSSRLIDLSFFSSRSFSEQDASPMTRSVRQKIVHSPLSVVSSHSERCDSFEVAEVHPSVDPDSAAVQQDSVNDSAVKSRSQAPECSRGNDNNSDKRCWSEVIDLSCEDDELEADLVAIACQESAIQHSSHSEASSQPTVNHASSVATPVPTEPTIGVMSGEHEAREAATLLALFNAMSEDPAADTVDTVVADPVDAVDPVATKAAGVSADSVTNINTATATSTNVGTSFIPFSFANASADLRYIGGRSVHGRMSSGFGRVSSLGVLHSRSIDNADKTTSCTSAAGATIATARTCSGFGGKPSRAMEKISFARGLDTSATHRPTCNPIANSVDNSARPRQNTTSLFCSSGLLGVTNVTSTVGAPAPWNRSATASSSLFRNTNAAASNVVTTTPTVSTNNTSTTVRAISTTTTATASSSTSAPVLPSTTTTISSPISGPVASSTTDPSLFASLLAHHPDNERCHSGSGSVPFVSSAALESKEDDSAITEELLVDLVQQESEQEASDLKEALQLSLLALQSSSLAENTSAGRENSCSSISNSGAGVPVVPASSLAGIDNMQPLFHTGDDLLLQHALQASLQDSASIQPYNGTNNDSQSSVSAAAETSRQMNVDVPYVNFAARNDCWDDCDEDLMRAIERSLQE